MSDPWAEFTKQPAPAASADPWADFLPKAKAEKPSVVEDVAKSGASGLVRGATSLAGLVGDMADHVGRGADAAAPYVVKGINRTFGTKFDESPLNLPNPTAEAIGSQSINRAIDSATGLPVTSYKPQTVAGEYARTVGEFAPGLISPGTMVQKVVGGVIVPALVSETAGQVTKGTAIEPYARAAGAVVGGVGASLANRPSTAQAAVSGAMGGVDDATMTRASQLMEAAQQRGVALTWPEAVSQVTGGGATGLTGLQRVVEGSQGGQGIMGPFMAQRPGQITSAAASELDNIAVQSRAPSTIGPAVGAAAESRINDVRGAINTATDPLYSAASGVRLSPQDMARVQALPGYQEAADAVRKTPQLARYVQGLPDDSVGFLNEVKKYLDTAAENAAAPINTGRNMQVSAGYGLDAAAVKQAGEAASPQYAQALAAQQHLRQQYLEPLMQGPLGRLADKSIETKKAIGVLFPSNPLAGSAGEISDAVGALASKNPTAARQLVRAHVESVFNEATQQIQAGANQFGGAGFVAALRGNPQQAENLAAAIQGVAGPQVRQGFDEFLNVVAATGQRQRIGSQTAFNQAVQGELQKGGAVGEAVNAVATAGIKLPGRITKAYEEWRLGRNTEQIARLITDPNALPMFRRLAQAAPGSSQAQAIAARITSMTLQSRAAAQPRE